MTISSFNQSSNYNAALFPLSRGAGAIADSTFRLASGSRFARAGDDVAALSISTRQQSQLSSLRQSLVNSAQANSLLQVAYGGLSQVSDLLTNLKAVATQANSGTLTNTERTFLNQQFTNYLAEIDRIASTTSFGDVNLLDGSISNDNSLTTGNVSATNATGQLIFNANIGAGQTVVLNGVTFTEGVNFAAGVTTNDSVQNLANALNTSTNPLLSGASYLAVGASLNITAKAGGELGRLYRISTTGTANDSAIGSATNIATTVLLQGGSDNGISAGSTLASGTIGDTILNTQSQTSAFSNLVFSGNAAGGQTLTIDNGNGGNITFNFVAGAPVSNTQIQVGATTQDTIRNIVGTLSNYSGTDDYVIRQLQYDVNGTTLTIRGRLPGTVNDLVSVAANVGETIGNAVFSNGALNNGTATGVSTVGISNPDFVGRISGFSGTFLAPDNITLSLTVGGSTYSGTIADTTPAANTTVRLNSTNGGYFDIELRAASGLTVNNASDASAFAARIDNAFSTLNFTQERAVTSLTGAGALAGGSAFFRGENFTERRIDSIDVTESASGDARIVISVNGETFRSQSGIGNAVGARQRITLVSDSDANRSLTLVNGSVGSSLTNSTQASDFEADLRASFGADYEGNGTLTFAVSEGSDIAVRIRGAGTQRLFNSNIPSVETQVNAGNAIAAIDDAADVLGEVLAEVSSSQARLQFNDATLASSISNIDAARSVLADTDIATESTRYASLLVQQQAGIAVLAQAQSLSSSLLELVRVKLLS